MVDKVIGELPGISSLDATSLFVAEQSGQAVKVSGKQLTDFSNVETTAQVEQAKASAQAAKTAQDAAEAAILKGPIIQNGTWWVYSQTAGAYQDTGIKATGPQGIPGPTSSVNGISPDVSGNITLTAGNVNAYSKTESDNLLQKKANASSVYTKSETYTKEETNTLLQKKADKDHVVNPNLLDNWYFVNPVDQRGGYVYPPNSPYADRNGNQIGATSKYLTIDVTKKNPSLAEWAEISIDGTTYYGYIPYAVRGYTGAGYGIDRWKQLYDSTYCLIQDGYVSFYGTDFGQMIETKIIPLNTSLTYSVLTAEGILGSITFQFDGTQSQTVFQPIGETKFRTNFIYNWGNTYTPFFLQTEGNVINVVAMKLELGSQQTLAHQENGVWVLNEIPDYGEQLRRCMRYYQRIVNPTRAFIGVANALGNEVWMPITTVPMRTKPTVSMSNLKAYEIATNITGAVDAVNCYYISGGYPTISITISWQSSAGRVFMLNTESNAYLELNAEL